MYYLPVVSFLKQIVLCCRSVTKLSPSMVKEWVKKQRQAIRPWSDFVNTNKFRKPASVSQWTKRATRNIEHYQTNYIFVFTGLIIYCMYVLNYVLLKHFCDLICNSLQTYCLYTNFSCSQSTLAFANLLPLHNFSCTQSTLALFRKCEHAHMLQYFAVNCCLFS